MITTAYVFRDASSRFLQHGIPPPQTLSDARLFCKNKQVNLTCKNKLGNLMENKPKMGLIEKFNKAKTSR